MVAMRAWPAKAKNSSPADWITPYPAAVRVDEGGGTVEVGVATNEARGNHDRQRQQHDGDDDAGQSGGAGDASVVHGDQAYDGRDRDRALPAFGGDVGGEGERHGRTAVLPMAKPHPARKPRPSPRRSRP